MGRHFRDLYGSFMDRVEYDELSQAINEAEEALRTGNQSLSEKAVRVLHNRVLGSGVASQLYMASRAMNSPSATAEERATLGQAIERLRYAAKNGPRDEVDKIVKELRPKVSEVISREDHGTRVEDRPNTEGGVRYLGTLLQSPDR